MVIVKKEIQKDFPPVPSSFIDRLILKVQVALINARTPQIIYISFPLQSILLTLLGVCLSVCFWLFISYYASSWTIVKFLVFVILSNFVVYWTFVCIRKIGMYYWIIQKEQTLRFAFTRLRSYQ